VTPRTRLRSPLWYDESKTPPGKSYPSGFLPVVCGNVREQPLSSIYRESPVMRALRNKTLKENAVFANFAAFAADRGRGRSP